MTKLELETNNDVIVKSNKNTMDKVLISLKERSLESIKLARIQLLTMNIESQSAKEALEHYAKNWEDTTHPGLLALACEAVGGKLNEVIPMQIVMLLLSAAMDIHDDIIDNSKNKRELPTVFGKFGKNIAILIGNAILVKGIILLHKYIQRLPQTKRSTIMDIIEQTLFKVGNAQLSESDLAGEIEVSPERYLHIIEQKASIIYANIKIGAILGRGTLKEIRALEVYGENLGKLIFLREEYIDIFEPEELKNRLKNEVLPLPLLYTFSNLKIRKKILDILAKPKISNNDAEKIVEYTFQTQEAKRLKNYLKKLAKSAARVIPTITRNNSLNNELLLLVNGSLENI